MSEIVAANKKANLMTKRLLFALLWAFPTALSFAQTEPENTATSAATKEYQFSIKSSAKKAPAKATLKLSEKKDLVYLYFEASDLPSGKYKIFKTESCSALTKQIRSNKPLKDEDVLYSFDTKYGNISGENNLAAKNFQELNVGQSAFALVKIERKNNVLISCVN